jgi:hypothetical protein
LRFRVLNPLADLIRAVGPGNWLRHQNPLCGLEPERVAVASSMYWYCFRAINVLCSGAVVNVDRRSPASRGAGN